MLCTSITIIRNECNDLRKVIINLKNTDKVSTLTRYQKKNNGIIWSSVTSCYNSSKLLSNVGKKQKLESPFCTSKTGNSYYNRTSTVNNPL